MPTDLLQLIEQHKNLLSSENYQSIIENYDVLPEELRETIVTQLQNAAYLEKMIAEYEDQRIQALEEASKQLKDIKSGYLQTYKEAFRQIEAEDKNSDDSSAEDALKFL